jgi:hypothetical protein
VEINSGLFIGVSVCLAGGLLVYELQQLRYAVLALVSLSAKKGSVPPVNLDRLAPRGSNREERASQTHIHFPTSQFPEQTDEDRARKNPPQLR